MKVTGITSIDHAPQVVAEWLNQLETDLGWPDRGQSFLLLRQTLHAIRDFLTVDEAADLAAQLPLLIRGLYFEGWRPSETPVHPRSLPDFVERVMQPMDGKLPDDPVVAISAVFGLLQRKISEGEYERVVMSMRKSLRDLLP